MVYEIIGSRILAPYIGTSTYVWTSLIGVILGSLSLGYWLGGRLADRRPDVKVLASAIFIAAGLISLTTLIKDVFSSFVGSLSVPIELKAVVAALVLFAPASVCLGFVTPYAVRLKIAAVTESGRTVGNLYALSTIGSILGTFVAGFFLIPFVGSVRTLYLVAGMLFAVAVMLAPLRASQLNIAAITLFVLGVSVSEISGYMLKHSSDLHDVDTEYSRVRIFNTVDPVTQRPVRALATDPYITQSAIFLDSDELVLPHNRFYHLARHFKRDFTQTLMIGGAGYTFPHEYLKTYKSAYMTVVEIDPGMTDLARRYFRLIDDPRLRIVHEDGRVFLNRTGDLQYDVVLVDAFGSLFSVPFHLATVEAVERIKGVLTVGGVVILNLGSAVDGDAAGFLQAEVATYKQVFGNVSVFKVHPEYPDTKLQNLILVATKWSDNIPLKSDNPEIAELLDHYLPADRIKPRQPLTDDLAPAEYYNSIAQNQFLTGR
jgi:spermidine synthase